MITWYESSTSIPRGGPCKLLISLLKIPCQQNGKPCTPFGSDPSQEDTDGPEMAVAKLFSSCKRSGAHIGGILNPMFVSGKIPPLEVRCRFFLYSVSLP
uniref:Uncharacterized protein n=1 Tax=Triticum urartu TaxID=4572 RepID=A0A8R7URX8_TRIUA